MSNTNEKVQRHLSKVREMASKIYSPQNLDKAIHTITYEGYSLIITKIFTASNEYTIYVKVPHTNVCSTMVYCHVSSRTRRPGETWNRGNDLPDGEVLDETWDKIMMAIIRYEVQDIKSNRWVERYYPEKDELPADYKEETLVKDRYSCHMYTRDNKALTFICFSDEFTEECESCDVVYDRDLKEVVKDRQNRREDIYYTLNNTLYPFKSIVFIQTAPKEKKTDPSL